MRWVAIGFLRNTHSTRVAWGVWRSHKRVLTHPELCSGASAYAHLIVGCASTRVLAHGISPTSLCFARAWVTPPPRTSAFLCLHTSFLEKTSALRAPGVARRPGLSGRGPASAPRLNSRGAAHTGAQHPVGRPSLATVGAGATTTRCTCSGGGSVCLSSLSIIRSL